MQGAVHHIRSSGRDQTSAIQAGINGAASGDTIYFDSGTYVVNGAVTLKSGQLYIGDTQQFNSKPRSVLSFNNSGYFQSDTSNCHDIAIYGLQFVRSTMYLIGSPTDANTANRITITNCIFDNQDYKGGPDFIDWGGMKNSIISWCSFFNGAGTSNDGFGANCSNLTVTRCRWDRVREAMGWSLNGTPGYSNNLTASFNHMTNNYRIPIEWWAERSNGQHWGSGLRVTDNYIDGWLNATDAEIRLAISIVAGGDIEIARNFTDLIVDGQTSGIQATHVEFDSVVYPYANIHDNYLRNGQDGIAGNYSPGTVNQVTNNNFWMLSGTHIDVNPETIVTGTTYINNGIPIPPACGAGP